MTDTKEPKVTEETETQEETSRIVTVNGRDFDISTDEGFHQLKGYTEATSRMASTKANENHKLATMLAKEKSTTPDEIKAQIASLRENGEDEKADQLTVDLAIQSKNEIESFRQTQAEEMFFQEYKASRPEIFESIPEGLAKDVLLKAHREALYTVEDPVAYADQILGSYIKTDVPPQTAKGRATSRQAVPAKKEKEEDSSSDGPTLAELLAQEKL